MKTSLYREPIIAFGFALPAVIFVIVAGGAYLLQGQAADYLTDKRTKFRAYETNLKGLQLLESQVGKKKDDLERWRTSLAAETGSAFSSNLREISESVPNDEFQQTVFEPVRTAAGFGTACLQPSSQVHLSTRGTFRATQKVLLRLETEMPQLQLQELKIDPNATSSSALNFQFGYTAWEK